MDHFDIIFKLVNPIQEVQNIEIDLKNENILDVKQSHEDLDDNLLAIDFKLAMEHLKKQVLIESEKINQDNKVYKDNNIDFLNIAQEFQILSHELKIISEQIIEIGKRVNNIDKLDYYEKVAYYLKDVYDSENKKEIKLNLKKLRQICVLEKKQQDSYVFSLDPKFLYKKYDKETSTENYLQRCQELKQNLQNELDDIRQKTQDFVEFNINYGFLKSLLNQSNQIKEIDKGTCFMGTNNGAQMLISEKSFDSGIHQMIIQLDRLIPGEYGMLSVGIIREEACMKQFPHNENGINKCLFRENSQDQMIHLGGGLSDIDSFADIIQEKDNIKLNLNFDLGIFEVIPARTVRKYISKLQKIKIPEHKWRFAILWTGSQHSIKLVSSF